MVTSTVRFGAQALFLPYTHLRLKGNDMTVRYSPPGSPTLAVEACRTVNGVALFVVTVGEGQSDRIVSPVLSWKEAYVLLTRNGTGVTTAGLLESALSENDERNAR